MTSADILYENGNHWVKRTDDGGYEVYRVEATHSVRCAQIGYKGAEGLARAKAEADRREHAARN